MQWSRYLKANVAYGLGSVANSGALLVLVPFLVNQLSPEDYGGWSLIEVSLLILQSVVLFGLDTGMMRQYWYITDERERARLFGSILLAVIAWGCLVAIIGLFARPLFSGNLVEEGGSVPDLIPWILLISLCESLFAMFLTLFRIREQPVYFATLSVARTLIFLVCALGFVMAGWGLRGAILGRFAGVLLGLLLALIIARRYILLSPDYALLLKAARYGWPLLPYNLASFVLFASDRYILGRIVSLESVAIYTFAYKIATLLHVVINYPFSTDWAARRYILSQLPDAKQHYARIFIYYLLVSTTFALLIIAMTPLLYTWFAPPVYWMGISAIPWLLLANIFAGLEGPVNIGIMLSDKTKYLPMVAVTVAALTLVLNLALITRLGLIGAAIATTIAYGLQTGGLWWVSRRIYRVRYSQWQALIVLASAATAFVVMQWLDHTVEISVGALMVKVLLIGTAMGLATTAIFRQIRAETAENAVEHLSSHARSTP